MHYQVHAPAEVTAYQAHGETNGHTEEHAQNTNQEGDASAIHQPAEHVTPDLIPAEKHFRTGFRQHCPVVSQFRVVGSNKRSRERQDNQEYCNRPAESAQRFVLDELDQILPRGRLGAHTRRHAQGIYPLFPLICAENCHVSTLQVAAKSVRRNGFAGPASRTSGQLSS